MNRREDLNQTGAQPVIISHRNETLAEHHVSPSRLAAYWGVHPNTVYRDVKKGALPAYRLPGGQLRIRLTDARRYGRPIE